MNTHQGLAGEKEARVKWPLVKRKAIRCWKQLIAEISDGAIIRKLEMRARMDHLTQGLLKLIPTLLREAEADALLVTCCLSLLAKISKFEWSSTQEWRQDAQETTSAE